MKEILIALAGFTTGWLVSKTLDNIWEKIKKCVRKQCVKWRLRKRCKQKENNYVPNISIIAEGLPIFNIDEHIQISISNHCFMLKTPVELCKRYPSIFKNHSDSDIWLKNCGVYEIEHFFEIQDLVPILEECKREVTTDFMNRSGGCFFNNYLYGLISADGFGRSEDSNETPILTLEFFKTDYYSHKVMWQLTQKLRKMGKLPTERLSVEQLNNLYHCFRTSLGISIIAILPSTNEIVLTRRSKTSSYGEGKEWIYVSVTETISETDFDDSNNIRKLSVMKWIKRGLNEELGLKDISSHYDDTTIQLYDMFFENYFYQDGLTASIMLSEKMDIEQLRTLPAKDKKLEVKEIFTIPNKPSDIEQFINNNHSEMREQTIFALQSYALRLKVYHDEIAK